MSALTRDTIVALLREKLPFLGAEYGVSKVGLFGSFARGHADENSDVDLVVEFERPIGLKFVELTEYLERLLGRKVDVLTPAGIAGIRVDTVARSISESIVYV